MEDLILIRGDKADLEVSGLLDDQGNATVFGAGDILVWTAKARLDSPDVLIQKSSASGGITIDVGTDQATVAIRPADWANLVLPADLNFVWDLQITISGDATQISTLDSGTGIIRADVTGNTITEPATTGGVTCTPWATPADALGPCVEGALDADDLQLSFQIATDILYELCPRKYRGACVDEVRPLARWRQTGSPGWWASSWSGMRSGYGWCSCNRTEGQYGCASIPEIRLPGYPVDPESVEVTIDGDAFTDFEILDRRRLVRTDGDGWPCCQDLTLADTETGTWKVRYGYGVIPPPGGRRAAAMLGCELYRAFHPEAGECSLPSRITNITRQGVSMAILDPLTLFADGRVGLPFVDMWLASQKAGEHQRVSMIVPGRTPKVARTR